MAETAAAAETAAVAAELHVLEGIAVGTMLEFAIEGVIEVAIDSMTAEPEAAVADAKAGFEATMSDSGKGMN